MSDSPSLIQRLSQWLSQRADDDRGNLRLFVSGASLFFIGLGLVLYADQALLASVGQELIAAFGILLAAVGALMAAFGYLALSLLRILRFIRKDD